MAALSTLEVNAVPTPCYEFNILPYMARRLTTVGFIKELSAQTGIRADDFPPLDDYIDTDHFNNLLCQGSMFSHAICSFTFDYAGYEVTIDREGAVNVVK